MKPGLGFTIGRALRTMAYLVCQRWKKRRMKLSVIQIRFFYANRLVMHQVGDDDCSTA
jgi:hypothetical protein